MRYLTSLINKVKGTFESPYLYEVKYETYDTEVSTYVFADSLTGAVKYMKKHFPEATGIKATKIERV